MLCVHSAIEIVLHNLKEITDRNHHPIHMVLANETLVDADDWSFFALRVSADVREGVSCAQLLISHPVSISNSPAQIVQVKVESSDI